MAEANWIKKLKDLKPFNKLILLTVFSFFLVLGIVLVQKITAPKQGTISEDQIKIQKGEKIVIVNESGLVEYRTPGGVYYDVWDSSRVQNFFESMRAKARAYLANPPPKSQQTESGFWVTLYLDGKEITFWVSGDDEELKAIYEELELILIGGGSLAEFFDFSEEEEDAGAGGTPTQTPGPGASPTPTPTPTPGGGGGGAEPEVVDCVFWAQQAPDTSSVISNTVCLIEQE